MSGKAPERIWARPSDMRPGMWIAWPEIDCQDEWDALYVLASKADEWKRQADIMKKALIEIEMFQGPAAYERLPRMARKALDECGVKK